jgi:hypothetical protein
MTEARVTVLVADDHPLFREGVARAVRERPGLELVGESSALIADGYHARADGFVSLAVVASAAVVALGFEAGDPIIGLVITVVILRITWQSIQNIRADPGASEDENPSSRKDTPGRRPGLSLASGERAPAR